MAFVVVWHEALLEPLDTARDLAVDAPGQFNGIGHLDRMSGWGHRAEDRAGPGRTGQGSP